LARRAWLLQLLRKTFPTTPQLLLDSGNFSDNPNELGEVRTRGLLEGMGKLGYQVVNIGERDLALGYDDFVKRTADLPMTFISTNVVRQDTKEPAFRPYTVIEGKASSGGASYRVGVLGVTRFSPVWMKAGPENSNLGLARPADMVKKVIDEVRKRSDVVVLLAAMSKAESIQLARDVTGIDFIIGAYGGDYNSAEETIGSTRVFYSGNQGKRIGETRVYLDADRHVQTSTSFMHFLTSQYGDDPKMVAFVGEITAKLNKLKAAQAPAAPRGVATSPGGPGSR
jgi:2',3'-cyclic-nucleotide 2'-phosphodiesterase (5'-nucleotidase family)